jgi:hypothetical protein
MRSKTYVKDPHVFGVKADLVVTRLTPLPEVIRKAMQNHKAQVRYYMKKHSWSREIAEQYVIEKEERKYEELQIDNK